MTPSENQCGLCGIYPRWLRNRATMRNFITVYGLLGTIQSMAFIYIMVTLTTLEKRFKIPSRTTGFILSGNEISQILSLPLMYYGGHGNRPKWIAVGVALSSVSCFVLALPHFVYGPGKDALALTKEHLDTTLLNGTVGQEMIMCSDRNKYKQCDEEAMQDISYAPRLLIFFSQFILGIGTTLYFGLGQTYLDDNTKKKNTPMLLGFTFALRTIGPAVGFLLSYFCLSLYIDPTLHPVIKQSDPRWLGAWWLGWLLLGLMMGLFAFLIAMFPRDLAKEKPAAVSSKDGTLPLKLDLVFNEKAEKLPEPTPPPPPTVIEEDYVPELKELPQAFKRIFTNWILTCNNLSGVFYILGASVYITFFSKYLEVQYGTSAAGGTVVSGPISLMGMVLGLLLSGYVIGKFKPRPRPLFAWNVIIGIFFILTQITIIFLKCPSVKIHGLDFDTMQENFTMDCNLDCKCTGVKYSPVCHEATMMSFYSPCHAGCSEVLNDKEFGSCSCLSALSSMDSSKQLQYTQSNETSGMKQIFLSDADHPSLHHDTVKAGLCTTDCRTPYILFTVLGCVMQILGCSGKIGNVLVNYRCVEKRDKSFAQGITLMIISIFALIPGPIIFGAIIDSTCLIWEEQCGTRGNCWFYHKDKFRILLNVYSVGFCILGVIFDSFVWYLGKNLDLYGDMEEDKRREFIKEDTVEPNALQQQQQQKSELNGSARVNDKAT